MAVQVSYPGVYIEEFAPGAPIQGVGTSTAAFIGPASRGELDTPTKITSWDRFREIFGEQPLPGSFLWYAVRGFFENGGQVCYVVRASNGDYDELVLEDRTGPPGNPLIRVRARQPGDNSANPIQITVSEAHAIPNSTELYRPTSTLAAAAATGSREIVLSVGDGINFKPGDIVTIGNLGERSSLVRVVGDTLRFQDALVNDYNEDDTVRLADTIAGSTRTVRIRPTAALAPGALVPGTVLTITQGAVTESQIVETVQTEPLGAAVAPSYRVTVRQEWSESFSLDPDAPSAPLVQSEEFDFTVTQGVSSTVFNNLGIDAAHPRYFVQIINNAGGLVQVGLVEPPPPVPLPDSLPAIDGPFDLVGGNDEQFPLLDQDFLDALETLREVDDVNIIAIPGRITEAVQQALITHCEQMADRFAVLDAAPNQPLFGAGSIETQRLGLDSTRGYAGFYAPWLRVSPAGAGAPILVPPSGHVCGIMARSDNTRGVHKAPANEIVNGALGVERTMSEIDQGQLNLQGINIIRVFQTGGRPVLWGARTTATDRNWQYVNIRRLFLFLEESIEEGIRWAVFEPNNLQLWQKLKRTITEFLTRVWRDGALFGATAEGAFYVRIDGELNPFSEQALGRLNIEIGVRPSYPAEFIIVRIGIWQGGADVSES